MNNPKFIEYRISGWSPLKCRYLNIIHGDPNNEELFEQIITYAPEINIRLRKDTEYSEINNFCKTYTSKTGFSVGEVLTRIVDTFWNYADEFDETFCQELSLDGFNYDSINNIVWPLTSS